MKMVYTHENSLLVGNARNLLEQAGITVIMKNEFTSGGTGELSFLDTWPEIWVLDNADYPRAVRVIETALSDNAADDWVCNSCGEHNDPSFQLCWQCQQAISE